MPTDREQLEQAYENLGFSAGLAGFDGFLDAWQSSMASRSEMSISEETALFEYLVTALHPETEASPFDRNIMFADLGINPEKFDWAAFRDALEEIYGAQ